MFRMGSCLYLGGEDVYIWDGKLFIFRTGSLYLGWEIVYI